jgi:hypothetical protein
MSQKFPIVNINIVEPAHKPPAPQSLTEWRSGNRRLGEEQLDAGSVAGIGRSHATPTIWTVLSSS